MTFRPEFATASWRDYLQNAGSGLPPPARLSSHLIERTRELLQKDGFAEALAHGHQKPRNLLNFQ
jgi:hypothetical protein